MSYRLIRQLPGSLRGTGCMFVLLALAFSSRSGAAVLTAEQQERIDNVITGVMERSGHPSAVVVIDQGGETLYAKAFGTSNIEHEAPATVDTPYAMGSITKSFTALATLQLAEQGKIDLEAPLSTYLPDYAGPAKSVKVRMLLDHTSGLPNYVHDVPALRQQLARAAFTRKEIVASFDDLPLKFKPGSKFYYTNSGYYLLGLIIEQASGMDYYSYLDQAILQPLGMTHTSSGDDSEIVPMRAAGYAVTKTGYRNAPRWSHMVPFSAGSLVTTAADLVRYRRGVAHSPLFSDSLKREVVRTVPMSGGEQNVYSLGGLIVSEFEGHAKITHAGDIWGYSSNHDYYPDDDLTIIILTNLQAEAPSTSSIGQKIARAVFNIPAPEVKDIKVDPTVLERYAGDYDLHPFIFGASRYGFALQDGRLHVRFGGLAASGPLIPLFTQDEATFRASFDDEWIFEFHTAEDGTVVNLESHYRDGVFYATPVM